MNLTPRKRVAIKAAIVAFGVLFVLALFVPDVLPLVILVPLHTAGGWAFHLYRLFHSHSVSWGPGTLVFSAASLAAAAWITLGLARWMSSARGNAPPPSRAVLKILAMFLCACAAAIATSGVMHETAWLAQKRCIEHTNAYGYWATDMSHTKCLLAALSEYAAANGHYPDRLEELTHQDPEIRKCFFYTTSADDDALQPFIYLKPADPPEVLDPDEILLFAPGLHDGRFLIGQASGRAWDSAWSSSPHRFKKERPSFPEPEDSSP